MSQHKDLFGAVSLGYIVVESRRLERWQVFLKDGLGLHLAASDASSVAFRMDSHARRLVVQHGPAEDVAAIGLQLRDEAALQVVLERLKVRRIAIEDGGEAEAARRGVARFLRVKGPKGLPVELYVDALTGAEPLDMLASGFVTGAGGMGHVAMTTRLPEAARNFWQEIFDARLSDEIVERMAGVTLDIGFLRFNERHHSIALATVRGLKLDPIRARVQHFNLLAASLDDVAQAFRRCKALGFEIAHEIGQHPNDKEVSFYALSPSGFEVELGCNALTVDEAGWRPTSYQGISLWGHRPQNASAFNRLAIDAGNFRRGLLSLLRPEYSPI
ncbi:VOC family protein [Nevskia soli]|uniref:VOC family protein n=1 Tax=Nevskia soli TaxID=418856 RepID=UPI0004A6CA07|nr:VOC family protein [Nevskia soli]